MAHISESIMTEPNVLTASALDARALKIAENTPDLISEHLKVTNGKVRTRFPPEPNGYLHIGHAKSLNMNFHEAFEKLQIPKEKRETIFRYDDTNPEAESKEYIDAIAANLEWLGYTPAKVTYSSDHFTQLYQLAIQLIQYGKAYVCHQSKEEIEKSRVCLQQFHASPAAKTEEDVPSEAISPYRNRSIDQNLLEFKKMRAGLYDEGKACLRMKMDLASPNPNLWDQVAYRIKYVAHPHAGNAWCIYPTYDYTHCIVDALEHIDYSICTLEFETRRESYYWLLDALKLYKPKVYEFARLAVTYMVMSKRKLLKLVASGKVRGWNDPRLATLNGLRRRGFTPAIIRKFCQEIGVTRVQSTIQIEKLYAVARDAFGMESKRVMAVLDPVEVVISNFDQATFEMARCRAPDYPQDEERDGGNAYHTVQLTPVIYLDHSDIRLDDHPSFYGVAPGKQIRLKYAYNFTCARIETEKDSNRITRVYGEIDWDINAKPPKGIMTWVPENSPIVEVRTYSHLFKVPDLSSAAIDGTDWEQLVDMNGSEHVFPNARIDPESIEKNVKPDVAVQFERVGYFVMDEDSTATRLVLNQIVALREGGSLSHELASTNDQKTSRKDQQAQQLAAKVDKAKIPPHEFFRQQTELYSAFDSDGVPTHNAAGDALTKTLQKKLKKEFEKQKRLHEQYLQQRI
uniref:glutamine--tRNA ligase n=1 Tax=Albugo laibachii Nc14 TaxID=890382 RepID=F0W6T7_9STRA|nr:unnamed protein product [Albugo laibachii Nc14]|eukprot:CCA16832.1 unnamed protein product [Albugo laibachii Nc14]